MPKPPRNRAGVVAFGSRNKGTKFGGNIEYFQTLAIPKAKKNKHHERLQFDIPYEGFALFAPTTIEDDGVRNSSKNNLS